MPIRWSAAAVVEAMDEVEGLLDQAEPFLAEAETRARKATGIHNLPEYMSQPVHRLIFTIAERRRMRTAVSGVRNAIPEDALTAERKASKAQRLDL
jgi:hypothetical protein